MEINKDFDQQFMMLNKEQYESLDWLIKLDSGFLKNHKLMDYSLLLVVEMVPIDQEYFKQLAQQSKPINADSLASSYLPTDDKQEECLDQFKTEMWISDLGESDGIPLIENDETFRLTSRFP